MSSFKKIAWSGSAVLLAVVMALAVMAPTSAKAAGTVTSSITGSVWNGVMAVNTGGTAVANMSAVGDLVIAEGNGGDFVAGGGGALTLTAPANVNWIDGGSCTISGGSAGHTQTCAGTFALNVLTVTFTDGAQPKIAAMPGEA